MLRASCEANEFEFQLASIVDITLGSGVANYQELIDFADALLRREPAGLDSARENLRKVVGDEGVTRAAAVVGNFQMMNRALDTLGARFGKEMTPELVLMAEKLSMDVPEHWK